MHVSFEPACTVLLTTADYFFYDFYVTFFTPR